MGWLSEDGMGRLIPAWAGKTKHRPRCHCQKRAHPRVGGENVIKATTGAKITGSSPRGRGKP